MSVSPSRSDPAKPPKSGGQPAPSDEPRLDAERSEAGPATRTGPRASRLSGPAARARPTPVSTDAKLLAIASRHLARLGPKGVTVVGVAAEAGMTHANVYRYFPSRDALLDAVAGGWLRAVETELTGIADSPDPADDKIERLLTALSLAQRDTLAREPNLFAVHLEAAVASRPIARRHRVRLRMLVERVVEEGLASGAFTVHDRERAIAFIFDASYRFMHPLAIEHDAEVPRDLLEARLGTVIQAIKRVLRTGLL